MKTFESLMISTATLLVVFSSLVESTIFMDNGIAYDDKFHELFTKGAPVEEIIRLAVSWNADKQLDHFDQLYSHISSNDKWAKYSQEIINATRKVLQRALKEVGYKKKMNLEQYLIATYQIQNFMKDDVPADVLEGIELLEKIDGDAFEEILNRGSEEELEWELEHRHPYTPIPRPQKMVKPEAASAESTSEKSQDEQKAESQKSDNELAPESQNSDDAPVSVPQKPEDELISESQTSEESLSEIPELGDHDAEKQESKEEELKSGDQIQKPQESDEVSQEVEETTDESTNKSVKSEEEEEVIAQPENSEESVSSPQQS